MKNNSLKLYFFNFYFFYNSDVQANLLQTPQLVFHRPLVGSRL